MVIVSAKITRQKILLALLAAAGIILLLSFLVKNADAPAAPENVQPAVQERTLDGAANDTRVAFLQSYGWQVDATPTETREVRIPQEFNDVFTRYNDLQKQQGFDLSEYAGKTAKRYVYAIENHPDGEGCYATVLVHKNKIIGGDVSKTGENARMHGFEMPG